MSFFRWKTFLFWLSWAAYAAIIFRLSAGRVPGALSRYPDKILHIGAYAVFALLLINALNRGVHRRPSLLVKTVTLAAAILYGFTDEFHQSMVPGRHASAVDLAADAAGGLIGILLFQLVHLLIRRRSAGE